MPVGRPIMNRTISVCFVAPALYLVTAKDTAATFAGGAELQQHFLARGLLDAGFRVTVLSGDFGQPDETEIEGVRFIKIREGKRSIPVLRYFHPRLTSIWSAMRVANADIYYQRAAGAITGVAALFASVHRKRFVFAAAHDLDLDMLRNRELFRSRGGWRDWRLYRMGVQRADAIVTQHHGQDALARAWRNRETALIPSCYRIIEPCESDNRQVVLWVAVMRRFKRPELFLDLARRMPHLRFRMIGGPSTAAGDVDAKHFYRELEERACGIKNLDFLGFLPIHEAERHFCQARLFVNTSRHEGFPNTFLQAWARGVPTISFIDCAARDSQGPINTMVGTLEEMQDAINRLAHDKVAWGTASKRCRDYVDAVHSVPSVIHRYRALFEGLMGES